MKLVKSRASLLKQMLSKLCPSMNTTTLHWEPYSSHHYTAGWKARKSKETDVSHSKDHSKDHRPFRDQSFLFTIQLSSFSYLMDPSLHPILEAFCMSCGTINAFLFKVCYVYQMHLNYKTALKGSVMFHSRIRFNPSPQGFSGDATI